MFTAWQGLPLTKKFKLSTLYSSALVGNFLTAVESCFKLKLLATVKLKASFL